MSQRPHEAFLVFCRMGNKCVPIKRRSQCHGAILHHWNWPHRPSKHARRSRMCARCDIVSKTPVLRAKIIVPSVLIFARRSSAADPACAQDCELLISYVGCSVHVPMRDREVSFFEGTPVVGFFYTWTSHSAPVTDLTTREVCCFNCRTPSEYQVTRTARGGGHSPFHVNPETCSGGRTKTRIYQC